MPVTRSRLPGRSCTRGAWEVLLVFRWASKLHCPSCKVSTSAFPCRTWPRRIASTCTSLLSNSPWRNSWTVTFVGVRGGRVPSVRQTACRSRAAISEEHTSELQSLRHLVCRLLLEKKNKYKQRKMDQDPRRLQGFDAAHAQRQRAGSIDYPRDTGDACRRYVSGRSGEQFAIPDSRC